MSQSAMSMPLIVCVLEPPRLQGQALRVRGTLRWFGGPMIEVSVPEQIERVR